VSTDGTSTDGTSTDRTSTDRTPAADTTAWNDGVVKEIEAWRAKHEADYRREWATIEGLHFLSPGPQSAGSASTNDVVLTAAAPARLGRFVVTGDRVSFDPEPGVPMTINGKPAAAVPALRDDGQTPADEIVASGVSVVLHKSGERQSLRVRNPTGERATSFLGFTWFPLSREHRVTGRFIPDTAARSVQVVNTFGDVDTYKTEGVVEFTLQGRTLRLRPFTTRPKRFYIVFKDASSGTETYEAARFLYADLRDDGTTVLDFNEAYNPPCSFNPFTTCPIPLPENRLPVKILAGERKYPVHVDLPADGDDRKG
jgi:uncharacterized protein (DUF1684 family)